jgi:hypothetical protein
VCWWLELLKKRAPPLRSHSADTPHSIQHPLLYTSITNMDPKYVEEKKEEIAQEVRVS